MKLAFATNAFTSGKYSLVEAMRIIAREGYTGVEILADRPLLWLPSATVAERLSIEKTLKETGLAVSCVNGFTAAGYYGERKAPPGQQFGPSFSDLDPEIRKWRVWYTKRIVDFTRDVGGTDISISSGNPPTVDPGASPRRKDTILKSAWKAMIEAICEVVDYAKERGVNINIEYEPGLLVGGEESAAKALVAIPEENFGVNFDIGHSYVCGEDVVSQIKRFKHVIHGVQVEDIGVDKETGERIHYHLVPGEGVMPLREIFETFKEVGYDGWFTVELYNHFKHPVMVARKSFAYFKKLLSEVYGS